MEERRLGQHGPLLSVVGFGAWAVGGGEPGWRWGLQDDAESLSAIRRALDLGINWIDTAPVYGFGHSEEVLGRALAGLKERPLIATKCGLVWDSGGHVRRDLHPTSIRAELEASLRRLSVEVVDLYQCHWPDPSTPLEESWLTMAALRDEGKVRHIGVSNFDSSLIQRCLAIRHVDLLQVRYSLLVRQIEDDLLPFCAANGIGVVAYSPMNSGLLAGHFDLTRLTLDDWRRSARAFQPPLLHMNLAFVERLRPIAASHGKTPGQLAVAWILRRAEVTSAIVGARRPDQVEENVGAAGWQLAGKELIEIDRALVETGARA